MKQRNKQKDILNKDLEEAIIEEEFINPLLMLGTDEYNRLVQEDSLFTYLEDITPYFEPFNELYEEVKPRAKKIRTRKR